MSYIPKKKIEKKKRKIRAVALTGLGWPNQPMGVVWPPPRAKIDGGTKLVFYFFSFGHGGGSATPDRPRSHPSYFCFFFNFFLFLIFFKFYYI
jgi:hypothetical protein